MMGALLRVLVTTVTLLILITPIVWAWLVNKPGNSDETQRWMWAYSLADDLPKGGVVDAEKVGYGLFKVQQGSKPIQRLSQVEGKYAKDEVKAGSALVKGTVVSSLPVQADFAAMSVQVPSSAAGWLKSGKMLRFIKKDEVFPKDACYRLVSVSKPLEDGFVPIQILVPVGKLREAGVLLDGKWSVVSIDCN